MIMIQAADMVNQPKMCGTMRLKKFCLRRSCTK
jgi:hypothetical protein